MTTALDAVARGIDVVASTVDAGLNAKSELIAAATQGLLRLASRVPLVGQIAGALEDLFAVYKVRCIAKPPAGEGVASTRVESNETIRVHTCTVHTLLWSFLPLRCCHHNSKWNPHIVVVQNTA